MAEIRGTPKGKCIGAESGLLRLTVDEWTKEKMLRYAGAQVAAMVSEKEAPGCNSYMVCEWRWKINREQC